MTWFSYYNYGTVLQAKATTQLLTNMGFHTELVQYYPATNAGEKHQNIVSKFMKRIFSKMKNWSGSNRVEQFNGKLFDNFKNTRLPLTDLCEDTETLKQLNKTFDLFICGSDQIWSPMNFDSHYFLDFVSNPHAMIAYAPSLGVTHISEESIEKEMKTLVSRFDHLSVREAVAAKLLSQLTGKDVETVLDPTLLLGRKDWTETLALGESAEEPYLLIYFLGSNMNYWRTSDRLARQLGLRVKIIPVYKNDIKKNGAIKGGVGPAEFVKLIRDASFVCTDSFHGIAFSINFNKDFCAFRRFKDTDENSQNSRIDNFLNLLNLQKRLWNNNFNQHSIEMMLTSIDYVAVNQKLNSLRSESLMFLEDSLSVAFSRSSEYA